MKTNKFALPVLLILLIVCASYGQTNQTRIRKAVAHLSPAMGYKVSGIVTFTRILNGVHINADIKGLPAGKHGFHVNQNSDCGSPDKSAAGTIFNPDNVKQGWPNDTVRCVGDMGNLIANKKGIAHYEWTDTLMTFSGRHNIIGKSVTVDEWPDNYASQHSKKSKPHIACGIIKKVK
jgi:Cu-Zn family superoxide dismutase